MLGYCPCLALLQAIHVTARKEHLLLYTEVLVETPVHPPISLATNGLVAKLTTNLTTATCGQASNGLVGFELTPLPIQNSLHAAHLVRVKLPARSNREPGSGTWNLLD